MRKHVLITYKWDPERGENRWLFWLQKKLEEQGFGVTLSKLDVPTTKTHEWVSNLQSIYSIPTGSIHIIEHDPGCLTILKYLEYLSRSPDLETVLLVAGIPIKRRNASSANNYARLESSHELAVFESSSTPSQEDLIKDIDAKLVILYSAEPEALQSNQAKKLSERRI